MTTNQRQHLYAFLAEKAFIHIESNFDDKIDYRVSDIINDKEQAQEFVDVQKEHRETLNSTIVGTLFGKRYSVLGMGIFTLLVDYGLLIDTSPELVGIKLEAGKPNRYYIEETAVKEVNELSTEEVERLIRVCIKEHHEPLFDQVAKVSKSKSSHLHSLVSHNLFQRSLVLSRQEGADIDRIQHYLDLFTTDVLFKDSEKNPLQFTFELHTPEEGDPFYIRKHCCLSYLIHKGDKSQCCGTCPHLFSS
ncbi:(2Fe-2S)-binding protein [Pontibacillus salipaludis]|uniref:(2Fe-2S)-binding protein n=1 Tax=Pontibacillus salipaludis TaxID=1697394 RepID=UPI0031E7A37A